MIILIRFAAYKVLFEDGFYNATTATLEVSNAVLPVQLDDDWFLSPARRARSYHQAPKKKQGEHWEDGLDNISYR